MRCNEEERRIGSEGAIITPMILTPYGFEIISAISRSQSFDPLLRTLVGTNEGRKTE